MASAPHRTSTRHRPAVVRGPHEFHIVGYSERKPFARLTNKAASYFDPLYADGPGSDPLIKSAAFQVGNYTWDLVCIFGVQGEGPTLILVPGPQISGDGPVQGHLTSITLELLTKTITKDVIATPSLQIDDPLCRWPPAVWRSDAAHRFCRRIFAGMSWTRALPDAFRGHEERYVTDDDRLTIICTVDILQEDTQTAAETRKCLVSVVPAPTIPREFQQFLLLLEQSPKLSDVTFLVEDTEFRAHRLVLAMRSPVFATELFGDAKESTTSRIRIDDMDASTFRAMIRFIYTDELPMKPINHVESRSPLNNNFKEEYMSLARKLLVAADRYDLERLRLMCENILSECINVATVMKTLLLVRGRQRCYQLQDSCIKYMSSDPDVYNAVTRSTRPPAQEKSTSRYNLSDVVRGTHEFRIPIFSSLQTRYRVSQVMTSDVFKVGGYDWKINVYPSGYDVEEHISVYLCLCTDPGTATVKSSNRFRIDDPNGKSPSMVLGSEDTFTKLHRTSGFQKFIAVNSAKSQYVGHDGSLTIHCDLDVHKEACTTSTSTTIAKSMIVVPPSNIAWHLEQLMVSGQWSNVTFMVEESKIHAHGLIIAMRSPVLFETVAVETSNWVIRIDDMKAAVLRAVLHFVYTDELLPVDDAVAAEEDRREKYLI
uniref:Speckle-type POZ protein-like protein n=1 Tax=Aegilops tauschii TaxID=37682 RepID=M8AIM1_AEGTA